jgi:hypothetical protein
MMATLTEFSYVYRLTIPGETGGMFRDRTHVVPAVFGSEAGLLGAAMLPYSLSK